MPSSRKKRLFKTKLSRHEEMIRNCTIHSNILDHKYLIAIILHNTRNFNRSTY